MDSDDVGEVVAASASGNIWFLDMAAGTQVALVTSHVAPVVSLAVATHDASVVLSSCAAGTLRAWRAAPGGSHLDPLWSIQSAAECCCAALTSDGTAALAGYADGSLCLYRLPSDDITVLPPVLPVPVSRPLWSASRHEAAVVALVVHPTRQLALSVARDGVVAVTDLTTGRLRVFVEEHRGGPASSPPSAAPLCAAAASAGDAAMCCLAWWDRLLVLGTPWDDSTTRLVSTYRVQVDDAEGPPRTSDAPAAAVRFVPGSAKTVAFMTTLLPGRVLLFDYRASVVVRALQLPQMLRSMDMSADGRTLALGGTRGSVFIVAADSTVSSPGVTVGGEPPWVELKGHCAPVGAVRFVAGGALVSAAGPTLMVWRPQPRGQTSAASRDLRSRLLY